MSNCAQPLTRTHPRKSSLHPRTSVVFLLPTCSLPKVHGGFRVIQYQARLPEVLTSGDGKNQTTHRRVHDILRQDLETGTPWATANRSRQHWRWDSAMPHSCWKPPRKTATCVWWAQLVWQWIEVSNQGVYKTYWELVLLLLSLRFLSFMEVPILEWYFIHTWVKQLTNQIKQLCNND